MTTVTWHQKITQCIQNGGPKMVYQPVVDLVTMKVVGYEALARFPESDVVIHSVLRKAPEVLDGSQLGFGPNIWFAQAELEGLGVELELAAVTNSLKALDQIPAPLTLSFNASPSLIIDERLHDVLSGIPLGRIVLELTEHEKVADYTILVGALDRLRHNRGCKVAADNIKLAIDDTGAGYASMRHILSLAPDYFKLDISLVRGVDTDKLRRDLVTALISFGKRSGIGLAAEGIETEQELVVLRILDVQYGQGYLLGKPGDLP